MSRLRAWWWMPLLAAIPVAAQAGAGAYLVDDASVTPAGQCQVQSWAQWLAHGQGTLNTLPACSTGPVEWSLGLAGQNDPGQHQESPAVKWMIRDPDRHALGLAVNVGATWGDGRLLSKNAYAAATWSIDKDRRWAVNADVGAVSNRGERTHTLTGLGVRYKLDERFSLIAERIEHWSANRIGQFGMRWAYSEHGSVDVIAGRSDAREHHRWMTIGWNVAL